MRKRLLFVSMALALAAVGLSIKPVESAGKPVEENKKQADLEGFNNEVRPLLQQYCVQCHNADQAKAKYRIDDISGDIASGADTIRWEKALEMISIGDMPPKKAGRQPSNAEREKLEAWITTELKKIGRGMLEDALKHPSHGNRVNHEELFSGNHKGPASSPPRLWRISPQAYQRLISDDGSAATLQTLDGHGFTDYASLRADEATVNVMLQTTEVLAAFMIGEDVQRMGHHSRLERGPSPHLRGIVNKEVLADKDFDLFVDLGFEIIYQRKPLEEERARLLDLFRTSTEEIGHRLAAKTTLRAMMMSPEFLFRMELGLGEELPDGRRMLSPMELAYAIGFAISDDGPDDQLFQAVKEGRLSTREDVEREVRRLLALKEDMRATYYITSGGSMRLKKQRVLRFFREFFGYHRAGDVFKDDSRKLHHHPEKLIRDADHLVLHALDRDENVLEFLLTTDRFIVATHGTAEEYRQQIEGLLNADQKERFRIALEKRIASGVKNPIEPRMRAPHIEVYGLPNAAEWNYELEQPFKQPVPRAGILTHPAWLVAHSGNFDNDIVRRGKWIREHLLADVVPDLPIGVDAQLTTDKTLTLREKFKLKVYNGECWRCHKKMNPLGNAFEMYDDFGLYRTAYHYDSEGNIIGSPREKRAAAEFTTKPVITSGKLDGTGDPALDGEVRDAVDLMHRIAKSDIARQSFIRHAFRYWMGRNETLDDSTTLIAAENAYQESGGSFKEMLVSLLTSDSFLYRK